MDTRKFYCGKCERNTLHIDHSDNGMYRCNRCGTYTGLVRIGVKKIEEKRVSTKSDVSCVVAA